MNSLKDSGFYDQKQQEEQYLLEDSVATSCYIGDDTDSELKEKESLHPEKQKWSNDTELILALISLSVGLGNVWRFPYVAYENGGGAFLIPYLIVVTFISRPLYFFESCLGQFSGYSSIKVWNMVPLFRGIGFSQVLSCCYVASYYTSIIGLAAYYFFVSFQYELPWTLCDPTLQLEMDYVCVDLNSNCSASNALYDVKSLDYDCNVTNMVVISPAEEYLTYHVLKRKKSIDDGIGAPDGALTGCLAFTFTILYLSMFKGVSSTGKAAYFNAIFPYIVMLILMVKVFTLPGAWDGVKFLFVPNWEELLNMSVWYNALMQSFYSLGIGAGGILNYSSFNNFRHNLIRYSVISKKTYSSCIKIVYIIITLPEITLKIFYLQGWTNHSLG